MAAWKRDNPKPKAGPNPGARWLIARQKWENRMLAVAKEWQESNPPPVQQVRIIDRRTGELIYNRLLWKSGDTTARFASGHGWLELNEPNWMMVRGWSSDPRDVLMSDEGGEE